MKTYKLKINDKNYEVTIKENRGDQIVAEVNGCEYQVELEGGMRVSPSVNQNPKRVFPQSIAPLKGSSVVAPTPKSAVITGGDGVNAPIPGQIKAVLVKIGDNVTKGQKVLILEAMKLENEIASNKSGTVKDILAKVGDSVGQDQLLITFN